MSLPLDEASPQQETAVEAAEWVKPLVSRLEVGEAEASDGPGPDAGLAS